MTRRENEQYLLLEKLDDEIERVKRNLIKEIEQTLKDTLKKGSFGLEVDGEFYFLTAINNGVDKSVLRFSFHSFEENFLYLEEISHLILVHGAIFFTADDFFKKFKEEIAYEEEWKALDSFLKSFSNPIDSDAIKTVQQMLEFIVIKDELA